MSPDIEDLLRDQLRGAASGAPHHLGVDDQDVLARGRRVVVRRRVLTTVGAAAAVLAIAGTIGVLAPQADNDALPAIPTPTVTPTPDPTPTITSTGTPSATVTAPPRATATPTSTPSGTPSSTGRPGRTPSSTPSRTTTPSPSSTPSTTPEWSEPVPVAGTNFRMRIVEEDSSSGVRNFAANLDSDGPRIVGYMRLQEDALDLRNLLTVDLANQVLLTNWPVTDVIADGEDLVSGEAFGRFSLPSPVSAGQLRFTVISMPRPVTMAAPLSPASLRLRLADGSVITIEDGKVTPQPAG